MIQKNKKVLTNILYFSAYLGPLQFKPAVDTLPMENIICRELFKSIYDVYCDGIYQIHTR